MKLVVGFLGLALLVSCGDKRNDKSLRSSLSGRSLPIPCAKSEGDVDTEFRAMQSALATNEGKIRDLAKLEAGQVSRDEKEVGVIYAEMYETCRAFIEKYANLPACQSSANGPIVDVAKLRGQCADYKQRSEAAKSETK